VIERRLPEHRLSRCPNTGCPAARTPAVPLPEHRLPCCSDTRCPPPQHRLSRYPDFCLINYTVMINENQIFRKIEEFKEKILLLEEKKQEEAKKSFGTRDLRLLYFFNREQKVYEFAAVQLQWVLSGLEESTI
jgi:hypothetical protein